MIAIVIIGMLATMVIAAFHHVRQQTQNSLILNGFRQFKSAFTTYEMENGSWPADVTEGILPDEMEGYISSAKFEDPTPVGGTWDWEQNVFGIIAGISLRNANVTDEQMKNVDEMLDDGNLNSGLFRVVDANAYTLVLQE